MRLLVSLLLGFLAEIATGLVIGAGMYITHGTAMPQGQTNFPAWVPIVAIVGGTIFTFLIAYWRASRNSDRAMTHALVVAAGAIALHLLSSAGAGQAMDASHLVADVGKLVAGAIAGEVVRRSRLSPSAA
jgi:hypothetical protein